MELELQQVSIFLQKPMLFTTATGNELEQILAWNLLCSILDVDKVESLSG